MPTFVMFTRLSPEALTSPGAVERLGNEVSLRLREKCPEVKWLSSYFVLGPYDYLDIYEAPNEETASKVALIVRSFGHATTETWALTPWKRYIELARSLTPVSEKRPRGASTRK